MDNFLENSNEYKTNYSQDFDNLNIFNSYSNQITNFDYTYTNYSQDNNLTNLDQNELINFDQNNFVDNSQNNFFNFNENNSFKEYLFKNESSVNYNNSNNLNQTINGQNIFYDSNQIDTNYLNNSNDKNTSNHFQLNNVNYFNCNQTEFILKNEIDLGNNDFRAINQLDNIKTELSINKPADFIEKKLMKDEEPQLIDNNLTEFTNQKNLFSNNQENLINIYSAEIFSNNQTDFFNNIQTDLIENNQISSINNNQSSVNGNEINFIDSNIELIKGEQKLNNLNPTLINNEINLTNYEQTNNLNTHNKLNKNKLNESENQLFNFFFCDNQYDNFDLVNNQDFDDNLLKNYKNLYQTNKEDINKNDSLIKENSNKIISDKLNDFILNEINFDNNSNKNEVLPKEIILDNTKQDEKKILNLDENNDDISNLDIKLKKNEDNLICINENYIFKCIFCSKTQNKLSNFFQHFFVHIRNKIILNCLYCEASFKNQKSWFYHICSHLSLIQYYCKKCLKIFNTIKPDNHNCDGVNSNIENLSSIYQPLNNLDLRNLLKNQKLGEQNFKLLKCSSCLYTSFDRSKLKRHYVTHTREKPFKCEICGSKFTQSGSLKTHLTNIHEINPIEFKCLHCDKFFTSNVGELKNHIKNIHKSLKCPVLINENQSLVEKQGKDFDLNKNEYQSNQHKEAKIIKKNFNLIDQNFNFSNQLEKSTNFQTSISNNLVSNQQINMNNLNGLNQYFPNNFQSNELNNLNYNSNSFNNSNNVNFKTSSNFFSNNSNNIINNSSNLINNTNINHQNSYNYSNNLNSFNYFNTNNSLNLNNYVSNNSNFENKLTYLINNSSNMTNFQNSPSFFNNQFNYQNQLNLDSSSLSQDIQDLNRIYDFMY